MIHPVAFGKYLIKKYMFGRFVLVGLINTMFGMVLMFMSYNVFKLSYWISSALNYILASILSYFLNKHYTFHNKTDGIGPPIRFAVNVAVCYLISYGIAKPGICWLLADFPISFQENLAMLAGMGLFTVLNYFSQRYIVFRENVPKI
jgi:putative flippase GtrA